MDTNFIISELEKNKEVFRILLENLSEEAYTWKQAPDKWCLLEIVCHLYDEEREDFRNRVRHTLDNIQKQPSPIEPGKWVESRKYMEQDYSAMLEKFMSERDESVSWLRTLKNPNWENYFVHPEYGKLTAKMFFVNWLAHDYLHIRQIIKLKYDYLSNSTNENLLYAGGW